MPFVLANRIGAVLTVDQQRLLNDLSNQHVFQASFDGNVLAFLSTCLKVISTDDFLVLLLGDHDDRYQTTHRLLLAAFDVRCSQLFLVHQDLTISLDDCFY